METAASPYSNLKIFAHADKLNEIAAGERVAPIYLRIKPTNYCNHKCYYCSYADTDLGLRDSVKKQDQIPYEKMMEIISDIKDMGVRAVTFSGGGEPLIYPYIQDTFKGVLDAGIDLSLITNGQLLKDEKAELLSQAKWVRVSFDSADAKTYSKIRGIPEDSFGEVCKNISDFSKIKSKNCELGVNFVINHENYNQILDMGKMLKELGVNHVKYTARVTTDLFDYHKPFRNQVVDQIHKAIDELEGDGFKVINKYESDFDSVLIFKRCYEKCYINRLFAVIAADSKVYFCHDKAYVSEGVVGDISDKSFKDLWFSKEIQERYEAFDPRVECNHHCVYDDRNELLNTFFSLDRTHINFI